MEKQNDGQENSKLTQGEAAIIKRLGKGPIEMYYGPRGWRPEGSLPRPAKREDVDSLLKKGLVTIKLGALQLNEEK